MTVVSVSGGHYGLKINGPAQKFNQWPIWPCDTSLERIFKYKINGMKKIYQRHLQRPQGAKFEFGLLLHWGQKFAIQPLLGI